MTSQEGPISFLERADKYVRHLIWKNTVASSAVIHLSTRHEERIGSGKLAAQWHTLRPGLPPAVMISKTFLPEIKEIYFTANTFSFTDSTLHPTPLATFRKMLGPNLIHKAKVMRRIRTGTRTFWLRFDIHHSDSHVVLTGGIDGKFFSVPGDYTDKYPSQRREICHCEVLKLAREARNVLGFLEKYAGLVGMGTMEEMNRKVACGSCGTVKSERVGDLEEQKKYLTKGVDAVVEGKESEIRADSVPEVNFAAIEMMGRGGWEVEERVGEQKAEVKTADAFIARTGPKGRADSVMGPSPDALQAVKTDRGRRDISIGSDWDVIDKL